MISFIVGNMHVSTTSREIIAEFRRRMRNSMGYKSQWRDKNKRKEIYKAAINVHKANVATYLAVMRGI